MGEGSKANQEGAVENTTRSSQPGGDHLPRCADRPTLIVIFSDITGGSKG